MIPVSMQTYETYFETMNAWRQRVNRPLKYYSRAHYAAYRARQKEREDEYNAGSQNDHRAGHSKRIPSS